MATLVLCNDATTLMTQAQSIFSQASAILNSKDANGDYIYAGGKTDTAPVSVTSPAGICKVADSGSIFISSSRGGGATLG